jgi:hypothetical protein
MKSTRQKCTSAKVRFDKGPLHQIFDHPGKNLVGTNTLAYFVHFTILAPISNLFFQVALAEWTPKNCYQEKF